MFVKSNIKFKINPFVELSESTNFENIAKGRQGAVIAQYDDKIPLVRTTTAYNTPIQKFQPIHNSIIDKITKIFNKIPNIYFNNAMVEIYDSQYRKMGYHTDQSIDLDPDSYICLFSCYENEAGNISEFRKLKIKNKKLNSDSEIILTHNSIVLFSVQTNHEHVHKIVLDGNPKQNKWIGITFRLSKKWIEFVDDQPYLRPENVLLRMATDNDKLEFRKHKKEENTQINIEYPQIDFTISPSDRMQPY